MALVLAQGVAAAALAYFLYRSIVPCARPPTANYASASSSASSRAAAASAAAARGAVRPCISRPCISRRQQGVYVEDEMDGAFGGPQTLG